MVLQWEKVGKMFFGSFVHTLDDKGRLMVPRKMREELGFKAYIMKGFDGSLSIFNEERYQKLVSEFADEYFAYDLYRENEKVEQGKIYYVDLMGYKQTKHYLFLGLKNNNYIGVNKVEGLVEFVRNKGLKEIKSFGRKK